MLIINSVYYGMNKNHVLIILVYVGSFLLLGFGT